jgi:epimerase transport system membrane fusion protein
MTQAHTVGQPGLPIVKTSDTGLRALGMLIIVLCFGVFGTWSALAPLERAAYAPGTVKVASNKKTVQHLEGGQVKRIFVQDGEFVKQGDILVELESSQLLAQLDILSHQLIQVQLISKRLLAEHSQQLDIELGLLTLPSNDVRAQTMLLNQKELLVARSNAMAGRMDVLEQRIRQLQSNRNGLVKQNATTTVLLSSYQNDLQDQQELLNEGYAQISRVRELERNVSSLVGEVSKIKNSIDIINMQVEETKLSIAQLQKDHIEKIMQQLTETDMSVNELQEKISVVKEKIARTKIIAPVAGNVLNMTLHTVGGVVSPGRSILDIVPHQDRLIIEAQVALNDIDSVKLGSAVDVRFSVFNQVKTTVIEGRVEYISADTLVSESNGHPYYVAHIAVTTLGDAALQGYTLIPGMPADVLINTGTRTLLQYLLQPALDAYARSFIEE